MGCFIFCKTVTYQYWNVVNTPLSEGTLPDSFHEFSSLNELLTGTPYDKSIEYLQYNSGRKSNYRKAANKLDAGLYGGFGTIGIGMNTFPTQAVKEILNPSAPDDVVITDSSISPLNYTSWVSIYLVNTFDFNPITNRFTRDGIEYSVDLNTANSVNNTIQFIRIDNSITHTLDLPVELIGDTLSVSYYLQSSGLTTTQHTWTYDISSEVYPQLSLFTVLPDRDPVNFKLFPPLVIRASNSNYPNISKHADYEEYAELLGVEPENILDAFNSMNSSDLDKLDDVAVNQGVNLQAKDKHSLLYCKDFVKKLTLLLATYPTTLYDNEAIVASRGLTDVSPGSVLGAAAAALIDKQKAPAIELACEFDNFAYTLKFTGVSHVTILDSVISASASLTNIRNNILNSDESDYGRHAGSQISYGSLISSNLSDLIAKGVPWHKASEVSAIKVLTGEPGTTSIYTSNYIANNVITYFVVNVDGDMECYTLVNPITTNIVRDAGSGQTHIVNLNLHSEDAEVYFPLDWRIIKNYRNQVLSTIVGKGLYLDMHYAYWEQEEVWDWGLIAIIVAVYTGYYYVAEYGTLALAAQAALASMVATLVAAGVAIAYVYIIIAIMLLAALGVFGEEAAWVGSLFFAWMGFSASGASLGANKATFYLATTVGDTMNNIKIAHLVDDLEAVEQEQRNLLLEVESSMDALEDFMEELGYYKRQRDKKYTAIALINYKQVATLTPAHPAAYIRKFKNSVKPGTYFDNIYAHT